MDKIKKSFIVILVLTLVVSYLPVNAMATSSVKNYFNIREIVNKKKENISDQDKLKIKLLNEEDIDSSNISISTTDLTNVEKYFSIGDNQIVISESFMDDAQLTDTDKSLVLKLINLANDELKDSNLKVNADYQIIDKNDNSAYLNGGNINKTKFYWWGFKSYGSRTATIKRVAGIKKAVKIVKDASSLAAIAASLVPHVAAKVVKKIIESVSLAFRIVADNIAVNMNKVNNKGKYGVISDIPYWFVGYGINSQTSKTK